MKTIFVFVNLLFGIILPGNDDKYLDMMSKNIGIVYKSQVTEELQGAVNSFDRIAKAEKTKWEPYYYSAFGNVMLANQEQDKIKKDGFLDLALEAVNKAKALKENESEIIAMEGFVHMIRLSVDPASRGQQYSMLSMMSFNKAVELNPKNPRALALLAQMQFGTAQFFKAPADEACATNQKAIEMFGTFKSDNPLSPQWGKGMAESMAKNCK